MSESYEHCMECDSLTGRAGRAEDSLYHGYIGPFCEDCFEDWPDEQVAQITTLRQQLTTTKAENEALRAQLKETEEKGRVLMDMCRDLKARVAELESQIWAVGADHCRAFILRKQAEAVDALNFPVALRKMWSGGSVQEWLDKEAQRLRQQADEAERAEGEK